ncbi:MAG: hypothetical protein HQL18_02465 [Candidatus Omnitrophica bacterium]|nr:hypothetical protein [Candidatus Omnitrophota bacterium]
MGVVRLLFFLIFLSATVAFASDRSYLFDQKLLNWLRQNVSPETGMPLSFGTAVPEKEALSHIGKPSSITGIIERTIVQDGISVYDAALWQIVLAYTGRTDDLLMAQKPDQYYWKGSLGELTDIRTGSGRQIFIYDPRDPEAVTLDRLRPGQRGFLFRILNAHGQYLAPDPLDGKQEFKGFPNSSYLHWEDWKPIAGENAWVVMAALHVLEREAPQGKVDTDSDVFRLAEELARAALVLQADNGGIRMAPLGTYYHLIDIDPALSSEKIAEKLDEIAHKVHLAAAQPAGGEQDVGALFPDYHRWYYEEISTENNFSWYAAFRMLWKITGEEKYRRAMSRIEDYLHSAWDEKNGVFFQGMHFRDGAWKPNDELFATDVQNWAVAILGPRVLDEWFGAGAARRIWEQTKKMSGVLDPEGKILGVGFSSEHNRLSVEWTAGAILAVRRLREYYENLDGSYSRELDEEEHIMRRGVDAFRYRLSGGREAYSYSSRRDWIPFGWFSHNKEILSVASTAWVALIDAGVDPFQLTEDQ